MKTSLVFLKTLIFLFFIFLASNHPLVVQIEKTRHLISLYQRKLDLLIQQSNKKNLTFDISTRKAMSPNGSPIFRLEEQIVFERQIFNERVYFMPPNYLVFPSKVMEISSGRIIIDEFEGQILSIESYQLTIRLSSERVKLINIKDEIKERQAKISVDRKMGKWHYLMKQQPLFLQIDRHSLLVANQKVSQNIKFKSEIISTSTINQFKVMFITHLSFGFFNPQSLEISFEQPFDALALASYFSYRDGVMFVAFRNGTLATIGQEKITKRGELKKIDYQDIKIQYLNGYLFVSGNQQCFDVYEAPPIDYELVYYRKVCPFFNQANNSISEYKYTFFKHETSYKFIACFGNKSELFSIMLPERQMTAEKGTPWKLALVLVCIGVFIYIKSKKGNKEGENGERGGKSRKKIVKKVNRDKRGEEQSDSEGMSYLKDLEKQMKYKRIDPKKFD